MKNYTEINGLLTEVEVINENEVSKVVKPYNANTTVIRTKGEVFTSKKATENYFEHKYWAV